MKFSSKLSTSHSFFIFSSLSKAILLLLVIQCLVGCASIVSHSRWNVPISSNPSGASVSVVNLRDNQEVFTGTTPATANLKSGGGFFAKAKYKVNFDLPGHKPFSTNLEAKFNGWYIGNLVFGGVIGFLIVDPATGAMYSLKDMSVNAELNQDMGSTDKHQLRVYNLNDIPESWKEQLVKVK